MSSWLIGHACLGSTTQFLPLPGTKKEGLGDEVFARDMFWGEGRQSWPFLDKEWPNQNVQGN